MAGLPRVELVDGTMTVRLVGGERLEVIVPENETQAERLLFREQAQREYKASRDHTHAPLPNETCTACQTGAVAGVNVEAEIAEKRAHFEAEAEKWRAANPDFGIGAEVRGLVDCYGMPFSVATVTEGYRQGFIDGVRTARELKL